MSILNCFSVPIYCVDLQLDSSSLNNISRVLRRFDRVFSSHSTNKSSQNITGDTLPGVADQLHRLDQFQWLNSQVLNHAKSYVCMSCVPNVKFEVFIQKSWPVVCRPDGGSIKPHTHRNAHLSAIFYVQTEPDNKSGHVVFLAPFDFYRRSLPFPFASEESEQNFVPLPGRLLIFPSSLLHYVSEYRGLNPRYSVSYDLTITCTPNESEEMMMSHPSTWLTSD